MTFFLQAPDALTENVMTVDIERTPEQIVDAILSGGAVWKCLPTRRQVELESCELILERARNGSINIPKWVDV